jgi:hypothetical protein
MAVPITALIGAITVALRAEFIGDGIAGIEKGVYRSPEEVSELRHVGSDAPYLIEIPREG